MAVDLCSFECLPADMQGVQVHSLQTSLREIKPSLFIRLQNGVARRGQSAVKLAGGMLLPCLPGMQVGALRMCCYGCTSGR